MTPVTPAGGLRRASSLTRARSVVPRAHRTVICPHCTVIFSHCTVIAGRVERSRTFSTSPIAMKLANIEEPP